MFKVREWETGGQIRLQLDSERDSANKVKVRKRERRGK